MNFFYMLALVALIYLRSAAANNNCKSQRVGRRPERPIWIMPFTSASLSSNRTYKSLKRSCTTSLRLSTQTTATSFLGTT
ncbi:hypothetical protein PG990_008018 [Apiospora arundinis]